MINDRYYIAKKIGQGRSSVFLCRDEQAQGKHFAFKTISPTVSIDEKETFTNEYRLLRRLEHPNIIKVVDSGIVFDKDEENIEKGSSYFTLEYFPGNTALTLSGCKEQVLISFIEKLCSAIFYLHQSRIIYYDLKAENILVTINDYNIDLRLIDFGFAHYDIIPSAENVRGSAEYIAPELLRKEKHDHRTDLYSLGILLYRIIYERFPFDTENEFKIFRGHLDNIFEFPECKYSSGLISIIRRLLEKDQDKRYGNCTDVIWDLNNSIKQNLVSNWYPVEIFSNRNDALTIINKYLKDKASGDIFIIRGSEGAGKTSLLLKIHELNNNTVYISYNKSISGARFIKVFLRRLLYSEVIYWNTRPDILDKIKVLLHSSSDNLFDEAKSLIPHLLKHVEFTLLIDNFNEADEYVLDFFRNIFPVFQVNNRKLIYSDNADVQSPDINLYNTREINLNPFTEANLSEYLAKSFAGFFPIEDLKRLILMHADLMPGNIVQFIKDILILNIIRYTPDGINIQLDEQTSELVLNSHDEIYRVRIEKLNSEELHAARIFSSVDLPLDEVSASILLKDSVSSPDKIINDLQIKNIIQSLYDRNLISISSEGLKKYIYKNIPNRVKLHSFLATVIEMNQNYFNRVELARQFQMADNPEMAFKYTYEEISDLLKITAYSYAKTLLLKLLKLPLDKLKLLRVKRDLAAVYFNLSAFYEALENINFLEKQNETITADLLLKASCNIGLGEYESGKNLLVSLLPEIKSDDERRKIFVEIANAHFELNNYQEASEICQLVIENENADLINLGKCYSLLALISIFMEGDMAKASSYFEKAVKLYYDAGADFKAAQMEMNLGNVFNMKGDHDKAEEAWNKSLKVITSIGNLELEGKLQINYGIYHFDKLHFEEARNYYNRALSIFGSLGNLPGEASVYFNIAEVYLITCEYEKAIESLNASIKLFYRLKNLNAELDSLFLLGKTYYIIGDFQQLDLISEIMKSKLDDEKVVEKSRQNFEVLSCLRNSNTIEPGTIMILKKLSLYYYEQDERSNYVFLKYTITDLLYRSGSYQEALRELCDETLLKFCADNQLIDMERYYWLGILARKGITENNSISYFIKASEYFLYASVVELTWKVFYNLAEEYWERGNIAKAEEFYKNSKSVLEYIFTNSTGDVRNSLLNDTVRKETYEKLMKTGIGL